MPSAPFSATPHIRVLSVAINRYKSDHIRNLEGCENDSNRLKQFLQSKLHIPDAHYKVVANEQATRKGIIDAFRKHFGALKDGGVALFHYSGHGSWEPASNDFVAAGLEPDGGRNEVLVCHDSGDPGIYNIADKELRWLISEVQYPPVGNPKNIHFICLFDCCHSGSMLRQDGEGVHVRLQPGAKQPRPLEAYLEGQYARLEKLRMPPADYISLAACSPRESAIEEKSGGLFTGALVRVLETASRGAAFPSYSELFSLIREITRNNTHNYQTPHFEYAGAVNPHHAFLLKGESQGNYYPELTIKDGEWKVAMGALHGLNADSLQDMSIPVFEHGQTEKPIGYARAGQVELEYTSLKEIAFESPSGTRGFGTRPAAQPLPVPNKTYLAGLAGRALPLKITANHTTRPIRDMLMEELEKAKNKGRFCVSDAASYELRIQPGLLAILRHSPHPNELIYGIRQTDGLAIQHITEQLAMISRREQINSIYTPRRSAVDPGQITLYFSYEDYGGREHRFEFGATDESRSQPFQVELPFDEKEGAIPYAFQAENNTDSQLYYYLVHLDRKYAARQKHEAYLKGFYPQEKITLYDSASKGLGLGVFGKGIAESLDIFLLIASKEQLSIPYVFEQSGFGACFGQTIGSLDEWQSKAGGKKREEGALRNQAKASWAVKRLEVKVIKRK